MSHPPNYEFQEWWNEQRQNPHCDLLLFDNSDSSSTFLTVDIRSPTAADSATEKDRSRSARQLSWLCLLRCHQLANSFASFANAFVSVLRTANRRIASDTPTDSLSPRSDWRLYGAIKAFLIVVVVLLVLELVAFFKGWHFSPPALGSAAEVPEVVYALWLEIRAKYLASALQSLTNVCVVLFLVQSLDRVILVLGCFWIKFRRLKPAAVMEYPSLYLKEANVEDFPMVLVQIPMCNEREVRRCRFRIPTKDTSYLLLTVIINSFCFLSLTEIWCIF